MSEQVQIDVNDLLRAKTEQISAANEGAAHYMALASGLKRENAALKIALADALAKVAAPPA